MSRFPVYEDFDEYDLTDELGRSLLENNQNNKLKNLMSFLDGKKTIIAGVIMSSTAYFVLKHLIDADTAVYINGLTTIVFGSAALVGKNMRDNGTLLN